MTRHHDDGATIVAPATAGGTGAVAIVRLSGPEALKIGSVLSGADLFSFPPRTLRRVALRSVDGSPIDDALAVVFRSPHSFTGEEVVEFQTHGSPVVVSRLCSEACSLGARPASAGEFSRRAFVNGKIDLAQAEGVADLISARTDAAAMVAVRQMRGSLREAVGPLRDSLLHLCVLLTAAIDFSDEEDVSALGLPDVPSLVAEIRARLSALLSTFERNRRLRDGATVALVGAVNVGKSRLLNAIVGFERAIVADLPGTTRDTLHADVDLHGVPVRLVDTAGLRDTDCVVEREGVRRTRDEIATADLLLFVVDGSRPPTADEMAAFAELAVRPHLLVVNKYDLPSSPEATRRWASARPDSFVVPHTNYSPDSVGGVDTGKGDAASIGGNFSCVPSIFRVSAKTGKGVEVLLAAVATRLAPTESELSGEAVLTRVRHVDSVRSADAALIRAEVAARSGLSHEFVAADLRLAAAALGELTGEISPDDLLDAVFSSFCIGK